jgi:feruloyl esterase
MTVITLAEQLILDIFNCLRDWTTVTFVLAPAPDLTVRIVKAAGLFAMVACLSASAAVPCESLTALTIPNASVTSATLVAAGAPIPGVGRGRGGALKLPAFCRVSIVSKPVPDSEIHFEVWLPAAETWNGKLEGTGNGGYSGALDYAAMQKALGEGYATAGSDTGHPGDDLKFAVGHPGKIDDWGWRAVHVMTEAGKLIVRANYGRFADHAYFTGCSTGGHQALMEAQRFPADYDGIVAGDPGNNRVRLNMGFLWSWLALYKDAASAVPASKLSLINKAAIASCDANDGVKDGLISEPLRCKFDPQELLCKGGEGEDCLTAPQVEAVRKIYSGAKNPRTG